jgi:uncharacterized protein YecT (DUF1311 family)
MKIVTLLGRMSYCAAVRDRATSAPCFLRKWAAFRESGSQPNKERSRTPLAPAHCRTLKSEDMSKQQYGCPERQAPHAGAPPIKSARFLLVSILLAAFALLHLPRAHSASFSCGEASSVVEKLVCESSELSRLDEALDATYQAARRSSRRVDSLRTEQRAWVVRRNACTDRSCVRGAYLTRLEQLELTMPVPRQGYGGHQPGYQRFRLLRGTDKDVCTAYTALMRATYFELPPYCGRPEPDDVPGFEPLALVRLADESIMSINAAMHQFISGEPVLSKYRTKIFPEDREVAQYALGTPIEYSPSTFDPPIDVDNDGIPDRVAYWSTYGGRCGYESALNKDGSLSRGPRHGLALDAAEGLDVPRTRELFGHPFPYVFEFRDKRIGKSRTETVRAYRPITSTITFAKYRGTYYFDGLVDGRGDLDNSRKADPSLVDTFGVFERRGGKTVQHCEIRWIPMNPVLTK